VRRRLLARVGKFACAPASGEPKLTLARRFARKRGPLRRGKALLASFGLLAFAMSAHADIILSASILNTTLKSLERLKQQAASGTDAQRSDAIFQTGIEADRLASLINDEIASHGMQERELIELAVSRSKELGISIGYNREKKKFFYDGAAFREYLKTAPKGSRAADAEFMLLSYQFYQSPGTDMQSVAASAEAKKRFLAQYPKFKGNAEVRLYLAIDYRDLYRLSRDAKDPASTEKYRRLTRESYQALIRQYPGTEQAEAARGLLRRFDDELRRQ
jgi:hypothetical protein